MVDLFKSMILDQYEASLCMVHECIERCPDEAWDRPVANHAFCQAVFHTLFATDMYLGQNLEELRDQAFHRENAEFFGTYEDLVDRPPEQLYDRASILRYMEYCRRKAADVVGAETEATLAAQAGFEWLARRGISRAEVHVYNIRHIQHHAGQLSLRLRLDSGADVPWCKSGWDA